MSSVIDYLTELRAEIVGQCSKCSGNGISVDVPDGVVTPCSCLVEFRVKAKLHEGGVPRTYLTVRLKDYKYVQENQNSVLTTEKFVEDVRGSVKRGSGLYFTGGHGLGKTFLMCCVLKEAAKVGFSVCFRSLGQLLSELSDAEFGGHENTQQFFECDLLAIDEVERVYKTKSGITDVLFDRLIRYRYGEAKSILVASNCLPEDLQSVHGGAVVSLFSAMLESVPLVGEDYRRKMKR
jgi:DNA replication protein DnaC